MVSTVCRLLSVDWESSLFWAFESGDVQDFEIGSESAAICSHVAGFKRSDLRWIVAYYVHGIVLSFRFGIAWVVLLIRYLLCTAAALLWQLELDLFNQHLIW